MECEWPNIKFEWEIQHQIILEDAKSLCVCVVHHPVDV